MRAMAGVAMFVLPTRVFAQQPTLPVAPSTENYALPVQATPKDTFDYSKNLLMNVAKTLPDVIFKARLETAKNLKTTQNPLQDAINMATIFTQPIQLKYLPSGDTTLDNVVRTFLGAFQFRYNQYVVASPELLEQGFVPIANDPQALTDKVKSVAGAVQSFPNSRQPGLLVDQYGLDFVSAIGGKEPPSFIYHVNTPNEATVGVAIVTAKSPSPPPTKAKTSRI